MEETMAKVLILYYSRTGNTKKMAEHVAEGVRSEDVEAVIKCVQDASPQEVLEYSGLIVGSPTYYGTMAWEVKKFFDVSVKFHEQFEGKVGGAFSSSANIGGGNETTVLDILKALLIHGMVVQGDFEGDHYGPVSIEAPDERARKGCVQLGVRVARLAKKLG